MDGEKGSHDEEIEIGGNLENRDPMEFPDDDEITEEMEEEMSDDEEDTEEEEMDLTTDQTSLDDMDEKTVLEGSELVEGADEELN